MNGLPLPWLLRRALIRLAAPLLVALVMAWLPWRAHAAPITVDVDGYRLFHVGQTGDLTLERVTLRFDKVASANGDLLPGQPLTYTLTVTNEGTSEAQNLYLHDALPSAFVLSETKTLSAAVAGSSYLIPKLGPGEKASVIFVGKVDPTLSSDLTLTNRATLTGTLLVTQTATTTNTVLAPALYWSQTAYTTTTDSDFFTMTLLLTPANPYAAVSVEVIMTDTSIILTQIITFTAGITSYAEVIALSGVEQTYLFGLRSPVGAWLGNPRSVVLTVLPPGWDGPLLYLPLAANDLQGDSGDNGCKPQFAFIPSDDVANEQAVIDAMNQERTTRGLAPLTLNNDLTQAARLHSRDMADNNFTEHTGSDGSDGGQRIARTCYDAALWAENIGWGYEGNVDEMMDWWMNSQVHRDNILNPYLHAVGVGYAVNANSDWHSYWTVNFGAQEGK